MAINHSVLADDLCVGEPTNVMAQMVRVYEKYRCSVIAVEEVPIGEVDKYGVISGAQLDDAHIRVERMVEKPAPQDAPSNLAVIGRYILTPDIFEILRNTPPGKNGELQLTDALQTQAANGKVLAIASGVNGSIVAASTASSRPPTSFTLAERKRRSMNIRAAGESGAALLIFIDGESTFQSRFESEGVRL